MGETHDPFAPLCTLLGKWGHMIGECGQQKGLIVESSVLPDVSWMTCFQQNFFVLCCDELPKCSCPDRNGGKLHMVEQSTT
jgi:hypothetical protein